MPKLSVIDDNSDICVLLKRYLSKNGFDVSIAQTGKDGLDTLKKEKFDIVLCDYRLPDKDGLEMIPALKALNSEIEIIIMTGYSDVRLAVQVMKKGRLNMSQNPFTPKKFCTQLRRHFSVRKQLTLPKKHLLKLLKTNETPLNYPM